MKRDLICISCPIGCSITVSDESGEYKVTGNKCKNGVKYGVEEVTNPQRVVPSTVVIRNGLMARLPVKTSDTIPKSMIFDVMKEIDKVVVQAPIKVGEVVLPNVCGTGVDIVATKTMPIV